MWDVSAAGHIRAGEKLIISGLREIKEEIGLSAKEEDLEEINKNIAICQPNPDFNGDKKVNLIDFSIFLYYWGGDKCEADFNADGTVDLKDFSLLMRVWTW